MEHRSDTISARIWRSSVLCLAALAVAALMTWPLVTGLGHLGRTANSGDARVSVSGPD